MDPKPRKRGPASFGRDGTRTNRRGAPRPGGCLEQEPPRHPYGGTRQRFAAGQTPARPAWLDSVPVMLEAAGQCLGVTLAMAPLIKARPELGKKLVAASTAPASKISGLQCLEAAAGSNEPNDQQKDDGADRGIDDLPDKAAADGNAELWKQQTGNQRAGDADENIADDPKAGAAHDLSGQPACNQADE
jgi:hypothetical protein